MSSEKIVLDLITSMWVLGTLVFGAIGLAAYLWFNQTKKPDKKHTTVPGLAPSHPELGNLPDFGKAGSLSQFLSNLHKHYGPIASFWWGTDLTVSLASPALFKQVAKLFNKPSKPFRLFLPLVTEHSLQYANDENGRRRHIAYSRCYGDGPLKNFYQIFHQLAEELTSKWMAAPPEKIDIEEEMFQISLKSLSRASFGQFFDDENEILHFYHHYKILWKELELQLRVGPPEPGTERDQEYQNEKDIVHGCVKKAIRLHEESGGSGSREPIVLDVIKDVTTNEMEMLGDALVIFFAGFHTSAMLLTWTLYYLAKHPEYQDKVYQEFCDVLGDEDVDNDNIKRLVYTRQVLDEALRCATIVTYAGRYSDEECTIDGHVLPPKTPIILALSVTMEDDKLWPEPHRFDPDHFSPERRKQLPSYAFEPFGFAGKRKCPGYKFALIEATTVLAVLLRKFNMRLVDETEGYVAKVHSLVPSLKDKMFLTAEKRQPKQ